MHCLYISIDKWSTSLYFQETFTIEIEIQNQKGLFKENPKNRRTREPWRLRTWKQDENLPKTTVETLERDPSLLRNLDDVLGTTFGNWGMKALISLQSTFFSWALCSEDRWGAQPFTEMGRNKKDHGIRKSWNSLWIFFCLTHRIYVWYIYPQAPLFAQGPTI